MNRISIFARYNYSAHFDTFALVGNPASDNVNFSPREDT